MAGCRTGLRPYVISPSSTRGRPRRAPTLERICTALIDRDEALQQVQGDLEKMRTVASNWEAEVGTVRADNRELRTWLQGAQAQQSQAEERARAAEQKAK
jgi:regulator of replication initiation timing